jgi:hypothetical protein
VGQGLAENTLSGVFSGNILKKGQGSTSGEKVGRHSMFNVLNGWNQVYSQKLYIPYYSLPGNTEAKMREMAIFICLKVSDIDTQVEWIALNDSSRCVNPRLPYLFLTKRDNSGS